MQKNLIITALSLFLLPYAISFAELIPSVAAETTQEKTETNTDTKTKPKETTAQPLIKKSEKTLDPNFFEEIKQSNSDSSNDEGFKNSTSTDNKTFFAPIEGADLTFSFRITINSDKSIKTPLILQPFVIEPDGHLREFGKYTDQIEEGLNTRFVNIPTQIENPLKGNYVVGYLANFQDPVEGTITFSGEVKGALSRPIKDNGEIARKVNVFVSEQAPVSTPSGREIISVSSDLEIF